MIQQQAEPRIGTSGIFTYATPCHESDYVIKPLIKTVSWPDFLTIDAMHRAFIKRSTDAGILIPETELAIQTTTKGDRLVIRQQRFDEDQLATNIVATETPELALKAAQLVFETTIDAVMSFGSSFRGFHGSLRNFAIKDIASDHPTVYFLDTFPPYDSPKDLLIAISEFGIDARLRCVAGLLSLLPEAVFSEHSIFNPTNMLAGICHSTHRRRPEISSGLTTWAICLTRNKAPTFSDKLIKKLAKGFEHDLVYRKLFPFLVRPKEISNH